MPRAARPPIIESDITGLKYFRQIAPLLERLHDDACERDTVGNRKLFFDHYAMLMLLYCFNPIVTSLRGLQQASELKNVQKKLGCSRAALGSLSQSSIRNCSRASLANSANGFNRSPTMSACRISTTQSHSSMAHWSRRYRELWKRRFAKRPPATA